MMANQYAERDASELDEAGGYYIRHVSAMTKEGLHSKGDIAAELGFRDMQIDTLTKQRDELLEALEAASAKMKKAHSDMFDQCLSNSVKNAWGNPVDVSSINDLQLEALIADKLISKAKGGAANHFPDSAKMVPDGWKLVPVVATKAMWAAWDSAPCNNEDDAVNLEAAYSAMLAAAPKFEGGAE